MYDRQKLCTTDKSFRGNYVRPTNLSAGEISPRGSRTAGVPTNVTTSTDYPRNGEPFPEENVGWPLSGGTPELPYESFQQESINLSIFLSTSGSNNIFEQYRKQWICPKSLIFDEIGKGIPYVFSIPGPEKCVLSSYFSKGILFSSSKIRSSDYGSVGEHAFSKCTKRIVFYVLDRRSRSKKCMFFSSSRHESIRTEHYRYNETAASRSAVEHRNWRSFRRFRKNKHTSGLWTQSDICISESKWYGFLPKNIPNWVVKSCYIYKYYSRFI